MKRKIPYRPISIYSVQNTKIEWKKEKNFTKMSANDDEKNVSVI